MGRAVPDFLHGSTTLCLNSAVHPGDGSPMARLAFPAFGHHTETEIDLSTDLGQIQIQLAELEHVMKSSLRTGMTAAAIAMAVKTAPVIISAIKDAATEGHIDVDQLLNGGADTAKTGAGAFLSGTITAGLTESMKSVMLGDALKATPPEAIALAVILAWEGIRGGFKLAKGEISQVEFAESLFRKSYYALIAAGGGCLGQALVHVPVAGYMLDSLARSLIAGYFLRNRMYHPHRTVRRQGHDLLRFGGPGLHASRSCAQTHRP